MSSQHHFTSYVEVHPDMLQLLPLQSNFALEIKTALPTLKQMASPSSNNSPMQICPKSKVVSQTSPHMFLDMRAASREQLVYLPLNMRRLWHAKWQIGTRTGGMLVEIDKRLGLDNPESLCILLIPLNLI